MNILNKEYQHSLTFLIRIFFIHFGFPYINVWETKRNKKYRSKRYVSESRLFARSKTLQLGVCVFNNKASFQVVFRWVFNYSTC